MATGTVHGTHIAKQYGTTAAERIDWATDTLMIALIDDTIAVDPDTHDYWDDLDQEEVANGDGYTTGGAALASKSVTLTGASNKVVLDAADVSWTFTASKSFRYAIVYKDTAGAASTDPIVCMIDFGSLLAVSGVFTIQFDADGVVKGTY